MKKLILLVYLILISSSAYSYKPLKTYSQLPSHYGIKYDSVKIRINAEIELNSWVIHPIDSQLKDDSPTIMIVGTDAGNMSNYIYHAGNLINYGFRVILFDYRGFGSSSNYNYDSTIYYDIVSEIDLVQALSFFNKKFTNISLLGLSFGSLVIQKAVSNNENIQLNAIIFDSPILDECEFAVNLNKRKSHITQKPNNECIFSLKTKKILILLGQKDILTGLKQVERFTTSNRNTIVLFVDAAHLDILRNHGKFYFNAIQTIINE